MLAHKYLPNYTVEDYNRWEGDWELIDGIPYAMSPSPMGPHQQLASGLIMQLGIAVRNKKENCGKCYVYNDLDWVLENKTVVRPDIALTCKKTSEFMRTPPVLLIEIISPSTGIKDRHLKFEIYEKQGVKYYIIIDPNTKAKQIFELTDGRYHEKNNLSSFIIHDTCSVELDLETALAELGESE